jgi:hypothetical protein
MNSLFVTKAEIPLLIKRSCRLPLIILYWLLDLEWSLCFEHAVQYVFERVLFFDNMFLEPHLIEIHLFDYFK